MNYASLKNVVVGAGFWGAVFAQKIASELNEKVLIIDKRNHIGGNCHSSLDNTTGIEYHKYGSHIFHTNSKKVWDYVNQFTSFNTYKHQVMTKHNNKYYSMPINLETINSFFNMGLKPYEAGLFIEQKISKANIKNPNNLEEKALSLIGQELYDAFIKGYTTKQWGKNPSNLPSSIIERLPVRTNYDTSYFSDYYQGIPLDGYSKLFENILSHKNIEIQLNTNYKDIQDQLPSNCKIIYTGMVDELLDYKYGELEWRSLSFEFKTLDYKDYQGVSVMNYSDLDVEYTRTHEFKHFHKERAKIYNAPKTYISIEYPQQYKKGIDAYYPVEDARNSKIYSLYVEEINRNSNIILGGRLGKYKYWNMDTTIENALNTFENTYGKQL